MVFSSIPAYLDPSNWHQQQQNHQIIGSTSTNHLLQQQPIQPGQHTPPPQPHGLESPGSIRPGSMSERARMANVQMPEIALKCPRCESTNTKFCYFNNYSLTQPRHFCKTCRRYWTRGGALRNVPVGGGCRRNKRSKSTNSKSSANCGDGQTTSTSTSSMSTNGGPTAANMLGLTPPQMTPLRFMSPLMSQLGDHNFTNELGLNYGGLSAPMMGTTEMNSFHNNFLGSGGAMASLFSSGGIEPWRLQQFPFLGSGLDSNTNNGIYGQQFNGELGFAGSGEGMTNQLHVRPKFSSSTMSQLAAAVKMEESQSELNFSRQMLGGAVANNNNNQNQNQWNNSNSGPTAPNWTDLSSFSSCSTSNAL